MKQHRNRYRQYGLLLATGGLLTTGFADCGVSGSYVMYDLSKCPPPQAVFPSNIKLEATEVSKMTDVRSATIKSCGFLVPYHVKEKIEKRVLLEKIEWREYDLFVGVIRDEKCKLVMASPWVGPVVYGKSIGEGTQEWVLKNESLAPKLLNDTGVSIELGTRKVDYIDGKSKLAQWCEGLR